MDWDDAEAAIRSHVTTQWALGVYAAVPLQFENDAQTRAATFVAINIEGFWAEKTIYGGAGLRSSIEGGLVYIHAFTPRGDGKATAMALVVAMTAILELQTLSGAIKLEGGNPPSPVDQGDVLVPQQQPSGNYYRCSGSVPFIVVGVR